MTKEPAASLDEERQRTDEKLREERRRVDQLLETAAETTTALDDVLGEAVEALETERAGVDQALADVAGLDGPDVDVSTDPIVEAVAAERARADEIIAGERLRAEELVRQEHERNEAENLRLANERQATDQSLDVERKTTDETIVAHAERLHVVSHDLLNPLQTITASTQMIQKTAATTDPEVQERLRRAAERIERAAQAMDRLVSDLLTNAALDLGSLPIELARHDLAHVVSEAVKTLELVAARRGLRFECALPEGPLHVLCDAGRITQVISNIAGNAVKFAKESSVVRIQVSAAGGEVRVCVRNEGPPVAPQDVPHLFERHYRGAHDKGGLGLGLHIARSLIEAHGGRVWYEPLPAGEGACFVFALPMAEE